MTARILLLLFLALSCRASEVRYISVTVLGGSRAPGAKIHLRDPGTELDAIAAAGGVILGADRRAMIHRGDTMIQADIVKSLDEGKGAIVLRDGDVLFVQEAVLSSLDPELFNRVLFDYVYRKKKGIEMKPGWWRIASAPQETRM